MKHRLSGPLALFAVLGALAILAPIAGAEEVSSASNTGTPASSETVPASPLAVSPMSLGQCEQNEFCIWQANDYEGNFSWLSGRNTGCHAHAGNPEIRSAYNRTAWPVEISDYGVIPSGGKLNRNGVFVGLICL
jgi:hypothetical protein